MSVPEERSPIIVEDPAMRDGFTQVPNALLRHSTITLGAKIAYGVLLSSAWGKGSCFPGQETMAVDMGVSKRSVIIYLKQLQDEGLISIKRLGFGKTNIDTLHPLPRSAESALLEVQKTTPLEMQILHPKNTQIKKDPKKKTKNSNFESSKAPTPMKRAQPVIPEFKASHPDLWQAGCNGVAEFIKMVGRGLWTDEAMNVSQWQSHNETVSKQRQR